MAPKTKTDSSRFPDPVYKETVLKPLFDGAKAHHVDGFRRIDRAHLVMLQATGILDAGQARVFGVGGQRARLQLDEIVEAHRHAMHGADERVAAAADHADPQALSGEVRRGCRVHHRFSPSRQAASGLSRDRRRWRQNRRTRGPSPR